jgi:hypothetical protein
MIVGPGKACRLSKDEAYKHLKNVTGVDFGFDIQRWREWGESHPEISGKRQIESDED